MQLNYMEAARRQAARALTQGQAPYGCVIEYEDGIIAAAHNEVTARQDAVAHAEILALQEAQQVLGSTKLTGCTIYTTAEPCPMCGGAILWTQPDRVVYGVSIQDIERAGGRQIAYNFQDLVQRSPFSLSLLGGVMRSELMLVYQRYYLSNQ